MNSSGILKRVLSSYLGISKYVVLSVIVLACLLLVQPSYLYAKSVVAQILLNHAWQKSQHQVKNQTNNQSDNQSNNRSQNQSDNQSNGQVVGDKHLPWQWADSYPVAKLSYVKGDTSWIILSGMTGRSMAFAPSWLEDSARPNQYGNTVISAHNDSHFALLENTEVGDSFLLEDKTGRVIDYRTVNINVVSVDDISPYYFYDEMMITLITCYPFETTNKPKNKRLVIHALKR